MECKCNKKNNICLCNIPIKTLDNEIWKELNGFEKEYYISNYGRVLSLPKEWTDTLGRVIKTDYRLMKLSDNGYGYKTVRLTKNNSSRNYLVHRLVAQTFLEDRNECVNHKDGNKTNNHLDNLEWVSYKENNQHAHDNKLNNDCLKTFVFEDDVLLNVFISINDASRRLNIPAQLISKYCNTNEVYKGRYKFFTKKDFDTKVVYFSRLSPEATIPSKISENGCYDVYCIFDEDEIEIAPNEIHIFNSGIASCFDKKYMMVGYERGSTGTIGLAVRSMVIDSGYRGEWLIPINNTNNIPIVISKNVLKTEIRNKKIYYPYTKAICQVGLHVVPDIQIVEISKEELLSFKSERMEGKLGSSGK